MHTLTLLLAAVTFSYGGLLELLLVAAICAVVLWAIFALLASAGVAIPPPVKIVLTALVAIFLILLLFRVFGLISP